MIMIYFSKLLETISLIDLIPELQQIDLADIVCYPGGGGGGDSHALPIRVCAAQGGRDFEAPGLERGIHFRRGF